MTHSVEVIESKVWVHRDGRTASIYGSLPWWGENDGWEMVTQGWTWRHSNGTVGLGRVPAKTREEAQEVADKINAKYREDAEWHRKAYPESYK